MGRRYWLWVLVLACLGLQVACVDRRAYLGHGMAETPTAVKPDSVHRLVQSMIQGEFPKANVKLALAGSKMGEGLTTEELKHVVHPDDLVLTAGEVSVEVTDAPKKKATAAATVTPTEEVTEAPTEAATEAAATEAATTAPKHTSAPKATAAATEAPKADEDSKAKAKAGGKATEVEEIIPEGYNGMHRPKWQTPLQVEIDVVVTRLYDLDETTRTASIDVVLIMKWTDDRLKREDPEPERFRRVDPEEAWRPMIAFYNQRPRDEPEVIKQNMVCNAEGYVKFYQRLTLELVQAMNFHSYPFDSHQISIMAQSFSYDSKAVMLVPSDESNKKQADDFESKETGQWEVEGWTVEVVKRKTEIYDQVDMFYGNFTMHRKSSYAVTNEILPMILITLFTLSAPFVNPDVFDMRVTIASIGLLTIMGFMFVVTSSLPPVGYMTWMMVFTMISFLFTFIISIECVFIHFLDPRGWAVVGEVEEEFKRINTDLMTEKEKQAYEAEIQEKRTKWESTRNLLNFIGRGDGGVEPSPRGQGLGAISEDSDTEEEKTYSAASRIAAFRAKVHHKHQRSTSLSSAHLLKNPRLRFKMAVRKVISNNNKKRAADAAETRLDEILRRCTMTDIRGIYARNVDYNTLDPQSVVRVLDAIIWIDTIFKFTVPVLYIGFIFVFVGFNSLY